jgi:hypothetical protein
MWPWGGVGQSQTFSGNQAGSTGNRPWIAALAYVQSFATGIIESEVFASTRVGETPRLPATIGELRGGNGSERRGDAGNWEGAPVDVNVVWDAIDPSLYAGVGTFVVEGTANTQGNMTQVQANVTVRAAEAFMLDELRQRVREALQRNKENYTSDSWSLFADAISDAQNILANPEGVTYSQIDDAHNRLVTKMNGLIIFVPTVTLNPASAVVNDSNLTATVNVGGTAAGTTTITLPNNWPTAGVTATVSPDL